VTVADRLLTAPEVSEILALPVDHVYKLARRDEIPHLRFGRSLRFRAEAITGWLEESERGAGGNPTAPGGRSV
jgi:excisionase family DNA binding protein